MSNNVNSIKLKPIESYKEFKNETDMLEGNICRICVSDNTEEIEQMKEYAIARIENMVNYRISKLKGVSVK